MLLHRERGWLRQEVWLATQEGQTVLQLLEAAVAPHLSHMSPKTVFVRMYILAMEDQGPFSGESVFSEVFMSHTVPLVGQFSFECPAAWSQIVKRAAEP
jgi:hypothetical protein